MMGQFVNKNMGDEAAKFDVATMGPFFEDRAAEKPDGVGLHRLVEGGFFGERDAVVKAGQLERVVHFEIGEDGVGGEVLDPERDGAGDGLDVFGQRGERGVGQRLESGKVGGGFVGPVHQVDMEAGRGIGKAAWGSAPAKSAGFGPPGILWAR